MKSDIEDFIENLEKEALKKRGGVPFGRALTSPDTESDKELEEPEEAPEELVEEEVRQDPGRKLRDRLRRRREKPIPGSRDRAHQVTKTRRERRLRDVD